jgi:hypothetical protein
LATRTLVVDFYLVVLDLVATWPFDEAFSHIFALYELLIGYSDMAEVLYCEVGPACREWSKLKPGNNDTHDEIRRLFHIVVYSVSFIEQVQSSIYSQANAEMEERRDKREESLALMQVTSS